MWLKGAAIRPVPGYAVVTAQGIERAECQLASDAPRARDQIDAAFARFESTQPHLAQAVSDVLSQSLDDTALALGYFLSIAIWLAFDHTFGQKRMREVSGDAIEATDAAIDLEEELRATHGGQPLDLDDVVSGEQPAILAFVHRHVDSALSPSLRSALDARDPREDIGSVYRVVVLLILCLSHAVLPVEGASRTSEELLA
ncbi:MAG: hypothetical protein ABTD50_01920 [Polyangiaceae bacterium]|jgi:hypothetical protein